MITSLSSRPATTPILTALRRISILQNAAKRSLCVQGRRSDIQRPVFVRAFSTQPVIADPPSPGKIATTFEPWWSAEDIEAGIETGTVRYGKLHVPAFETGQASVELDADDDGRRVRVKVPGFMARNRAVHGDRVAVRLMWKAYKRDDSGSDGTGEDEVSVGRVEDARARVVAVIVVRSLDEADALAGVNGILL
ncbi:DIS3 mitotic control [Perkinsus olseni]|uniref:DIS3 mitotic control n=1 Tax=Perkinsus olseni TaxID=32597 RepID=A0A7J6RA04_PEROL|nr:DIS3 mitotic control [Perkinsus olseni]